MYFLKFTCALVLVLLQLHLQLVAGEIIDANVSDRFCYPAAHKNTRKSCECSSANDSPWGLRGVHIDCSYKDFKNSDISEVLPLYVDSLDLSWNAIDRVPVFSSGSLRVLNLMHNNVSSIAVRNFAKLTVLRELYLSWNSIQMIDAAAFEGLAHLQVLDLSHNNLQVLPDKLFAPLLVIESLSLSWNRQLNESINAHQVDFYEKFGVQGKLQTLKLEACSLTELRLPELATLRELRLRRNQFVRVPATLPRKLELLDISENLLDALLSNDTRNYTQLRQLYVEDMPRLEYIGEQSLEPLVILEKFSCQNSRRLHSIDMQAFGGNSTKFLNLTSLIFRGTTIRTFNTTLSPIFRNLTSLDLNGLPLYCDCELAWLHDLTIETNGRCYKPSRLRGHLVSSVPTADFSCSSWPQWVYGIITLALIAVCSIALYLIVMGLRPHRRVTMRRKVGAGSPYARVTIQPNRQEY